MIPVLPHIKTDLLTNSDCSHEAENEKESTHEICSPFCGEPCGIVIQINKIKNEQVVNRILIAELTIIIPNTYQQPELLHIWQPPQFFFPT